MRFILLLCMLVGPVAWAEDSGVDEQAQTEALIEAQSTLTDPSKRAGAAADPNAAAAMRVLEQLAGNAQNSQKMYELAAELMQTLVQATGGNPEKMMQMLQNGKQNPEAFGKNLTPEQRKKLSDLAKSIGQPGKMP